MSFPGIKGKAIVKSVLSGDTIIIRGKANNGPPSEAILQFTMITSPRVGYKTSEQDEVLLHDGYLSIFYLELFF